MENTSNPKEELKLPEAAPAPPERRFLTRRQTEFLRRAARVALRIGASCAVTLLLVWAMFLLARGSAYISLSSEGDQTSRLSGLHSSCIRISADSVTADISQYEGLQTTVSGEEVRLSSASLSAWIGEYLAENGISQCQDGYLAVEGGKNSIELSCLMPEEPAGGGDVRYVLNDASNLEIDPAVNDGLSSSAGSLTIYPARCSGGAYQSFVCVSRPIRVQIPAEADSALWIGYKDSRGKQRRLQITPDVLPEYADAGQGWSFEVEDFSLTVSAPERKKLTLGMSGAYVLELWAMDVSRVCGYLSGDLSFQYTSTPRSYTLRDQLVNISGTGLNMALCKGIREGDWEITEALQISGEVTQMDISGMDLFPDMKMWLRENIYVAPVSLLSVVIAMYKLPDEVKKRGKTGEER